MSDWLIVVLVFWGAYGFDGLRRTRHSRLAVCGPRTWRGVHAAWSSLHFRQLWPWQWRVWADDPTIAFAPAGIVNRGAGLAGRPADPVDFVAVCRWEDVAKVSLQSGWLLINGRRFARATGAPAPEAISRLAETLRALTADRRAAVLHAWIAREIRPAHWRRRLRLAKARTAAAAAFNTATLAAFMLLSFAALPPSLTPDKDFAEALVRQLPILGACAGATYLGGLACAILAARRLRRWTGPHTLRHLLSAALFPPQALRWRALLTEALQPPAHPVELVAAVGSGPAARELAFQLLADLRWPGALPAEAAAIRAWHADALAAPAEAALRRAGFDVGALLAPPAPEGPASCAYCPRCRSQFTRADARCPQGVALQPLRGREP